MSTNYKQAGEVIEYTASGTISSGDVVVVGTQIGIALDDAVSGDVISVSMEGVFAVPKVDAAVIALGEEVFYDASAAKFDDNAATPATGDVSNCCVAWEAKGATTDETLMVKINVGVGLVT
jgi:predicted RecA/RadA family phage recombinase